MKLISKHNDHITFIFLPIAVIAIVLLYFFRPFVLKIFEAHWLILVVSLLSLFLPRMWQKSSTASQQISESFWKYLLQLWVLQLGCYLLFLQIFAATTTLLIPANVNSLDFMTSFTQLNIYSCLFPWALVALLAVAAKKVSYQQNKPGLLSTLLSSWFRNTGEDAVGISADFLMRLCLSFGFNLTLGFLALRLCSFINNYLDPRLNILQGLNVFTMILTTLILVALKNPNYQRILKKITTIKLPLPLLILCFILALAIIFSLLSVADVLLKPFFPGIHSTILDIDPSILRELEAILFALWWLAWTPWLSGSIAYLGQKQRPGFIILSVFFLPIVITVCVLQQQNFFQQLFSGHLPLNWLLWILALTFFVLIVIKKKYLTEYIRASLPETHSQKRRAATYYLRHLFQNAILFDWFFIVSGILIITAAYFIFILPSYILMILASLTAFKSK